MSAGVAAAAGSGGERRVVLDTNVLLALLVYRDGIQAPIGRALALGRWVALTDARCLEEFRRVLGYPQFGLDGAAQAAVLDAYESLAQTVVVAPGVRAALPQCRDRDDQKFLELARDGGATLLVTADKALLKLARRGRLQHLFRIVTPAVAAQLAGDDSAIVEP